MKKLFLLIALSPIFLTAQDGEIPFKTYTVNPDFCRGFQTSTGSFIFIPDNAFGTEDGSMCSERIIIKYREFHSQTDMFYSGLNMIWDDNGKRRMLESVGMFEIQAWCGNKRLVLKEGKQIQIRMRTRRDLNGLMSFIYDDKKNMWTRYPSQVMDFSFREKQNNADSVSFWGSSRTVTDNGAAVWDVEGGNEVMVFTEMARRMPEGFFKGMNIKNMGVFNYDGVIKDSLAVPMQPELFMRNATAPFQGKLYVVYPNKNTLVYYNPDDLKERFVLLNVKGIKMFVEFTDGGFGLTKDAEIDELSIAGLKGKIVKFIFDKVPGKPKNEKELAGKTGLNTQ
jgi:hypothetical protein